MLVFWTPCRWPRKVPRSTRRVSSCPLVGADPHFRMLPHMAAVRPVATHLQDVLSAGTLRPQVARHGLGPRHRQRFDIANGTTRPDAAFDANEVVRPGRQQLGEGAELALRGLRQLGREGVEVDNRPHSLQFRGGLGDPGEDGDGDDVRVDGAQSGVVHQAVHLQRVGAARKDTRNGDGSRVRAIRGHDQAPQEGGRAAAQQIEIDVRARGVAATARRDAATSIEDRSAVGGQREIGSCDGFRTDDDLDARFVGDLDLAPRLVRRDRK